MGFFNFLITMGVGFVMLVGAALTYQHRMAERRMEAEQHPLATVVARTNVKSEPSLAPLPKWDNKNYKGLVYR